MREGVLFNPPLRRGTLLRRYRRFLADVALETGEHVTAHCPNSGSMLSVSEPGSTVWLSPAASATRKLPFTWELIQVGDTLVGINTGRPNLLVAEAITAGNIAALAGYTRLRREVPYGRNSRIDLLLEGEDRPKCFVEVKNVTLRRGQEAHHPVEFPDCVTERGAKHLRELADVVAAGDRAVMVFLAQRSDASRFALATDIDAGYARTYREAIGNGVEALFYRCAVDVGGIHVTDPLTPVAGAALEDGNLSAEGA